MTELKPKLLQKNGLKNNKKKVMKKVLFVLILLISIAYGQSPTKGALNTIDTTVKPTIKMLAINKLDNLVYYWDLVSWSKVATAGAGATYSADLPLSIDGSNVISIPVVSGVSDGYTSVSLYNTWQSKWGPNGNNATGGDFIGTTNAQPFIIKTNNTTAGYVTGDGNFNWVLSSNLNSLGTGDYNTIFGYQGTMSGTARYNLMGGFQNTIASGVLAAVAIGRNTTVNYNYGMAVNTSSIANGQAAFAANNCQVNAFGGAGFGYNNEIATDISTPTTVSAQNRIFVIGNGIGNQGTRHNALTVLHGPDLLTGTKPLFGFNTLTPTSTISVGGSFEATYSAKTADYTANELDYTIHFTSGTNTFTLPTAVGCTGRIYVVKNTTGGNLTLATTSGQTIDGAAPGTLANGAAAQYQSTGSNWIKIN
jgi:hypothetical protein